MSDHDLVDFYRKSHSKEVIGEFFNRYMHLVFAVCMKYFRDDERAKDAVMEIFESLDEKLPKFDIRNFKGWLHRVSTNYCLMELRKKKIEFNVDDPELFKDHFVENEIDLHHDSVENLQEQKVVKFLNQLKESQRKCLEMMYFQNMSYKSIAIETGYTEKQVKSYIQNGRRMLKLLLKGEE